MCYDSTVIGEGKFKATESVAWIVFLNGLVQRGHCLDTKNAKFVLSLPRNAYAKDYSILDDEQFAYSV